MKMISANKLNRLWKNGVVAKMIAKTKVLKTMEEISASTNAENVAGANAVKALNDRLAGFSPVVDATGKITGYKTSVGGADTVFPFSNVSCAFFSGSTTTTGLLNVTGCAGFKMQSDKQIMCEDTGVYDMYYLMTKSNSHYSNVGKLNIKVNGSAAAEDSCGGSGKDGFAFEQASLSIKKGDTIQIEISSNNAAVINMAQCFICKQKS